MPLSIDPTPKGSALSRRVERAPRRAPNEARRACDIQGTAERAYALGLAYAARAGVGHVGVGRDGRAGSPELERALVAGLTDGGLAVARVGLGPTPMLGFAVRRLALDGAIMVTASHPGETRFKVMLGGERLQGEAVRQLLAMPARAVGGGAAHLCPIIETYAASLAAAGCGMPALHVVWDCANGATGPVVERLVGRLPGRHVVRNARIDDSSLGRPRDPALAANVERLAEAVIDEGADLAIAFDNDGSRMGLVDGRGRVLATCAEPAWKDDALHAAIRAFLAIGAAPGGLASFRNVQPARLAGAELHLG